MRAACRAAAARGVAVGAHVGYRDREGFGRRPLHVSVVELRAEAAEQIAALRDCARAEGTDVTYLKPHGALYHRAVADEACAAALIAAAAEAGGIRAVLCLSSSSLLEQAEAAGLAPVVEAFADRGYLTDGSLVPRGARGDLLDEDDAARQAVALATGGTAGSICLHGDSPGAVHLAARVAEALRAAGIELAPFT